MCCNAQAKEGGSAGDPMMFRGFQSQQENFKKTEKFQILDMQPNT